MSEKQEEFEKELKQKLDKEYTIDDFVELALSDQPTVVFDLEGTLDSINNVEALIKELKQEGICLIFATSASKRYGGIKLFFKDHQTILNDFSAIIKREDFPQLDEFYYKLGKKDKKLGIARAKKLADQINEILTQKGFSDENHKWFTEYKLPVLFGRNVLLVDDVSHSREAVQLSQKIMQKSKEKTNYTSINPIDSNTDAFSLHHDIRKLLNKLDLPAEIVQKWNKDSFLVEGKEELAQMIIPTINKYLQAEINTPEIDPKLLTTNLQTDQLEVKYVATHHRKRKDIKMLKTEIDQWLKVVK